mmetsp:Transcript_5093/g.9389  ORF Transcript_5093/g.9389 Transcript_5093/m.9389 type:complete len:94 (+) Transcript_5093:109-390(+)
MAIQKADSTKAAQKLDELEMQVVHLTIIIIVMMMIMMMMMRPHEFEHCHWSLHSDGDGWRCHCDGLQSFCWGCLAAGVYTNANDAANSRALCS